MLYHWRSCNNLARLQRRICEPFLAYLPGSWPRHISWHKFHNSAIGTRQPHPHSPKLDIVFARSSCFKVLAGRPSRSHPLGTLHVPRAFKRISYCLTIRTQDSDSVSWSKGDLVPPGPRLRKRHSSWSISVCCRLSLPLLLCCILVGAVYLELQHITQQTYQSSMVARVMAQRAVGGRARYVCVVHCVTVMTHEPGRQSSGAS
jgi:hypothetical protein